MEITAKDAENLVNSIVENNPYSFMFFMAWSEAEFEASMLFGYVPRSIEPNPPHTPHPDRQGT